MAWEKATGAVPEPSALPLLEGARVPKVSFQVPGFVVSYRNHAVVASPFGFAVPFSVAAVPEVATGPFVVTDGAKAGVVNDMTAPNTVPYVLVPMAQ